MHRLRALIVTLAASAAAIVPLASAQPSYAIAGGGHFYIVNQAANLCLSTNPSDSSTHVQVMLEPCTAGDLSEQWAWVPAINNTFTIQNLGNNAYLQAETNTDFGVVDTWPTATSTNQVWTVAPAELEITNGAIISMIGGTGAFHRCLDVSHGDLEIGGLVGLYHCTQNNNSQEWTTRTAQELGFA